MAHSKGANQRSLMSGQFVKEQVGLRSVGVGVGKSRPECLGDRASWSLKTERRREVTSKEHPSQERAGRVSGPTFSIPPALFWGFHWLNRQEPRDMAHVHVRTASLCGERTLKFI